MKQTLKMRDAQPLSVAMLSTQGMDDGSCQENVQSLIHEINNIMTALSCRWELLRGELSADAQSSSSLADVEQMMQCLSAAVRSLAGQLLSGS